MWCQFIIQTPCGKGSSRVYGFQIPLVHQQRQSQRHPALNVSQTEFTTLVLGPQWQWHIRRTLTWPFDVVRAHVIEVNFIFDHITILLRKAIS